MPSNPSDQSGQSSPKARSKKRSAGSIVGGIIGFLCVAALAIGCSIMTYQELISVKDDIWLHWFGVVALDPEPGFIWHGIRTSNKYCVHYKTEKGEEHEKCMELHIHLFEPNTDQPPIVRYKAASPDHASISWGLQPIVLIERLVFLLLMSVFSFVMALGSFAFLITTGATRAAR